MSKKTLLQHCISFLSAAACVLMLTSFFSAERFYNSINIDLHQPKAVFTNSYYETYYNDSIALLFADALKQGEKIVLYGSSELTGKNKAHPFRFLQQKLNAKCLAIGQGGNQLLSILTQLCAMNNSITDSSKVVIVLSPGWFGSRGTSVHSFLEYVSDAFLQSINNDSAIPEEIKQHIFSFVAANIGNISNASAYYKKIAYTHLVHQNKYAYLPFSFFYSGAEPASNIKVNDNHHIFNNTSAEAINFQFNWDSALVATKQKFLATTINNNLGSDSVFYTNTFLQKGKSSFSIPTNFADYELQDLKYLVNYLKVKKCNVFFLIQPVNPYMYDKINEMSVVMDSVEYVLSAAGMSYYNMFTANTNNYEKGVLTDAQHFSEYGWLKADKAIFEHFYLNKK